MVKATLRESYARITDPTQTVAVQAAWKRELDRQSSEVQRYNPYIQSEENEQLLLDFGIQTMACAARAHPHPACKAIENYMLTLVAPYVQVPMTFCFLRRAKLPLMGYPGDADAQILNEDVVVRDVLRYGENVVADAFAGIEHSRAFVHDTLHYYSVGILGKIFDANPNLKELLFTVVIPPEVVHGHESCYPSLYEIRYLEELGSFQFLPDGHGGGRYIQDLSCTNWLQLGKVVTDRCEVTVEKVDSIAAHHLFIARRGRYRTPKINSFTSPALVKLPVLYPGKRYEALSPMRRETMAQLFMYCKAVKKVTENDIWAKLRQILKPSEYAKLPLSAVTLAIDFMRIVHELRSSPAEEHSLAKGFIRQWGQEMWQRVRDVLTPILGEREFDVHQRLVDFEKFHYDLPVHTIRVGFWAPLGLARVRQSCGRRMRYAKHKNPPLQLNFDDIADLRAEAGLPEVEDINPVFGFDLDTVSWQPKVIEVDEQGEKARVVAPVASSSSSTEFANPPVRVCENSREVKPINPEKGAIPVSRAPETKNRPAYHEELVTILERQGVAGIEVIEGPDGECIEPIWMVTHENPVYAEIDQGDGPVLNGLRESLHRIGRRTHVRPVNASRAHAYLSDLCHGSVGTDFVRQKISVQSLKHSAKAVEASHNVVFLLGGPGSGKSRELKEYMKVHDPSSSCFTIVTPTVNLRQEWVDHLPNAHSDAILTFETALVKGVNEIVVADDFGKLPPGYLDALLVRCPHVRLLVVTGDSRQSMYHEVNQDAAISALHSEVDEFMSCADYYLNVTHRCARNIAIALGIYPARKEDARVYQHRRIQCGEAVLAPSLQSVAMLRENGHKAFTYAGSQGLTFGNVSIMLDQDTPKCHDRAMFTVLTRARDDLYLVEGFAATAEAWEKISCTPYLRTLLTMVREPDLPSYTPPEHTAPEPVPRTHLPVANPAALHEEAKEAVGCREERELFDDATGLSNVYQADVGITNLVMHHQAKDDTLVNATYASRLKTANRVDNEREFRATEAMGFFMFEAFREAMEMPKDPIPFDEELWLECRQEVEATYLRKPVKDLIAQSDRQDPDMPWNEIKLFLKSQWVKKNEKFALGKAKTGQPITAFKQETVMRTGWIARYIRRVVDKYTPSNIYIHREKTDLECWKWAREHWDHSVPGYANDYSEYDKSQDGCMLNFETTLARHLNVPQDAIEFYAALKMNSKTHRGVLKIMRCSGEGPTFDFNTYCNIAYHHLRHKVPKGTPQMYGGDDMVQKGIPVERPSWAGIAKNFQLVCKPEVSLNPTFVGWKFTNVGPVKDPTKLHFSLKLAQERGTVKDCLESYARDIYYLYMLGDQILETSGLQQAEVDCHHDTLRILHKHGYQPIPPHDPMGWLPHLASGEDGSRTALCSFMEDVPLQQTKAARRRAQRKRAQEKLERLRATHEINVARRDQCEKRCKAAKGKFSRVTEYLFGPSEGYGR